MVVLHLRLLTILSIFDTIIKHVPAPSGKVESPFRMLISNIDYDEYTGRIAVGKIERGSVKLNMPIAILLDTKGPEYRIKTFENKKITALSALTPRAAKKVLDLTDQAPSFYHKWRDSQ